ncbi:MAG TPA: AAA family ATPase [Ktedonobacterales bacterium]|nr:AAA family ATPase [Ktedonobacterales bacterium]
MHERTPLLVIVVNGLPATGKTTLARRLADDFHLPLLAKDSIKETLFETLGWSDRAWSRQLGTATMGLLYLLLEEQLRAGRPCIVESNFYPDRDGERFRALQQANAFTPFQILCVADGPTLYERYCQRARSADRHPGHVETNNLDEHRELLLRGRITPLPLGGTLFELDTTDFATMDYAGLYTAITQRSVQQ